MNPQLKTFLALINIEMEAEFRKRFENTNKSPEEKKQGITGVASPSEKTVFFFVIHRGTPNQHHVPTSGRLVMLDMNDTDNKETHPFRAIYFGEESRVDKSNLKASFLTYAMGEEELITRHIAAYLFDKMDVQNFTAT